MLSLARFIKKEIQLRENLVGTGFLDPPGGKKHSEPANEVRVTCIGEIVQTCGFDAESTYVFYDTFLPSGWSFEDANAYEAFETFRDDHAENNRK